MGKKTFALLVALTCWPLDTDQCHKLAANRLPWLVARGYAKLVVTLRGWGFYAATDKGIEWVNSDHQ